MFNVPRLTPHPLGSNFRFFHPDSTQVVGAEKEFLLLLWWAQH